MVASRLSACNYDNHTDVKIDIVFCCVQVLLAVCIGSVAVFYGEIVHQYMYVHLAPPIDG